MKPVIAFFLCISFFADCTKEEKLCCEPPEIGLFGKWVDVYKREDTLEVYTEGYRNILFDNSAYYRNNQATISDKNSFRMQFQFNSTKIGVKPYSAPASDAYNYFDFTWIQQSMKFTVLQNAIRPYLSSLPMGTYERVY